MEEKLDQVKEKIIMQRRSFDKEVREFIGIKSKEIKK